MYPRTRVNIRIEDQLLLEKLMEVTGLGAAEVVSLFLNRYGSHFLAWFNSNPHQGSVTIETPAPLVTVEIPEENLPAIEL
jgi:hypothetical protein